MYVNPFWFGFLIAIVSMIVLSVILAIIKGHSDDQEEEVSEEEFREILQEMTGKKFRVVNKNGYLVAEPVKDEDDDEKENGKSTQ